ncbi:MAG: adenylate/guanylate cyclase domain-containing protein [Thermoleophilaceae bacterium]|nr:adenylate/guanylate cyclase domain-containing protein [Thermoleophilaceae bacterium]
MNTSRNTSTADLLLEVMEIACLGACSAGQIAKQQRRGRPLARVDRRLSDALAILASEGLVTSTTDGAETLYRTSATGLATLEANGRYSSSAAVLFTDIVGSTELIGELGEVDAHETRQRHFALLREAIARTGGREVKSLGDGLMVIFGQAARAADCASTMQQLVAEDDDELGLRVGVHAGELLRDGDDYFGSTVITARRLCDCAGSGQTLISEPTCALVGDGFQDSLEPIGILFLKGLPEPVETSILRWDAAVAGSAA